MKCIVRVISLSITAALLLSSCNSESAAGAHIQSTTTGVRDVLESGMASEEAIGSSAEETEDTGVSEETFQNVTAGGEADFDLTLMNADLVYANVYSLVTSPDSYVGYTIRMTGKAVSYYDEATDTTYYGCFITDAAQCCSQGLEYRLSEGDYPEDDDEITVYGVFDTYTEGGNLYVVISDAVLE